MKVFEDLIDELKDENLLEVTVLESSTVGATETGDDFELLEAAGAEKAGSLAGRSGAVPPDRGPAAPTKEPPTSDPEEYYRKRSIEDVSSLQMVEHVFCGIEREHLKSVPAAYDDLEAKKALHRFLQVVGDIGTQEFAEAEFNFLSETEKWSSALAERDQAISTANLRRFCENSRPALSSQALIALARFYRNAAFSEDVRAKFDFVITRLFSRDAGDDTRRLLFSGDEMAVHLKALYADWASVTLFSDDEIVDEVGGLVTAFSEAARTAEGSVNFDELTGGDFFSKLHAIKESAGPLFFTPEVAAAAIDCNVRIGNRFVELILTASERMGTTTVEEKYGYTYDQVLSHAAGKTLHLVDLLKNGAAEHETALKPAAPIAPIHIGSERDAGADQKRTGAAGGLRVNKWLLTASILAVLVSAAMYFWAENFTQKQEAAEAAKSIDFAGSNLDQYIRSGRGTESTLYAITLPAFDNLPEDQQKEILRKAIDFAQTKGLNKVQLMNPQGRTVAFASKERVEILPK